MKDLFLLDPEINFLNHGSFGACPRPVFEAYQTWQLELERQPVDFMTRQANDLLVQAREDLSTFIGCNADEVVFTTNPTTAVNMLVRNLKLAPGDEILTTDHEYGAMDRTWRYISKRTGAHYRQQAIPLPVKTKEDFVETFWSGVTPRTKVIFISHITSPTGLIFPVEEICRKARSKGILTIVDGAHVPGQIPLNLRQIGADFYTGACHKWLMAPKGSAFLYARREHHAWIDPLIVSWGYESEPEFSSGSRFIDYHQWQGTRDLAAFLATSAAIQFHREFAWDAVSDRCHHLVRDIRRRVNAITGLEPICPETSKWFAQMSAIRLPEVDCKHLQDKLWGSYRIEVPTMNWNGIPLIRVSVQGYNDQSDADALITALEEILG